MRIAVLGTGRAGRTLAAGFARLGHEVVVGTRDPAETGSRPEWEGGELALASYADAADRAEVVISALSGTASLDVLTGVGSAVTGKVLVDVANPLDTSQGFPPTLTVKDTDSLAEQIQRALPDARVVKSLNTMNADVMVDPGLLAEETTVFVAGDHASARTVVRDLLTELGWRDIVEFDALSAARGLEMWLPLWIRMMQTFGTGHFNLRVVR